MDKPKVLYHEILLALKKMGLTVNAVGSECNGYIPLYKFRISSAKLPFGTLVHMVNNPDAKASGKPFDINNLKREQIIIKDYSFEEVSKACEVLRVDGNVDELANNDERIIALNDKGLHALNTEFYVKQFEKEDLERRQMQSVIDTNKTSQIVGYGSLVVGFISAIFIVITTLHQCKDKTEQSLQDINTSIQTTKKALDSVVLYQGKTDASIRRIADTLTR